MLMQLEKPLQFSEVHNSGRMRKPRRKSEGEDAVGH